MCKGFSDVVAKKFRGITVTSAIGNKGPAPTSVEGMTSKTNDATSVKEKNKIRSGLASTLFSSSLGLGSNNSGKTKLGQ